MDLRGCSQMHFISVIRGGEVIKVPNIARGTPEPKFMNIEEIYSSIDLRCHDSPAKCPSKVDRSLATTCGFQVKTEVKSEGEEEENELDYGAMTLRQLKNICKSHKRKASESVNSITVKQEVNDLLCDEDEPDMKETLGSLKRKVLMKTKAKKKCISSTKICKPLKIKVEDAEHDYSQLRDRSLTCTDNPGHSTSDTIKAVEPCSPDQDLNITSGNLQSNVLDQSSHEPFFQAVPFQNSICCLNQVSYEHLDHDERQNPLISKHPKIEEIIKVENSLNRGDQSLVLCGSEDRRDEDMTDLMACDEPAKTALSERGSSDFQDHHLHHPCPLQPVSDGNSSSEVQVPCIGPNRDCKNAEITNPGEAIAMDDNQDIESEVMRTPSTNCDATVKFDKYLPSGHGMASPSTITSAVEDEQLLVLAVNDEEASLSSIGPESNCHDTELINHDKASISLGDNPVTEAKAIRSDINNCTVVLQDKNCMPLVNSVESLHNVTCAVEDNQSSILGDDFGPVICSPDMQPCAAIDQQIGSEAREGHYKNDLVEQPPERLLSTRKTISPNSKERLRRAMNLAEMQDDTQNLSCKEKLFCEKNCVDTSRPSVKRTRIIFTSKRTEALCATEIKANNRQTMKKGKYERNLSFVKGNGKGPHGSPSVHAGSGCNSSLSCSQNAIAFSQQQMIDTERLATKLLTELHLMKEIVVDTLYSESRTCTTSSNNTDKARVAVENVKKVEESTKRWLSIMSRDCNRFCKILEEVEKNGSSPGKSNDKVTQEICKDSPGSGTQQDEEELSPSKNTTQKERKIMFADEAGESLCHVRLLEAKQDQLV